ncbi:ubiquinol-cytochrome-c reductase complex assembly factor 3 [Trematomus bernacchii]|uniref:ubiquinol-cytochrome-c reductase complex assembly factor 3 n=1 Tax=Trematomus bernacchii TaxID=40690 RepID=UPI00146F0054|nr:ubiquinol-cytochrome-c reductase complex assembly factor 3 [Trematomus bernacchii]
MSIRTLLASGGMIASIGLGYGMWSIISPGEDRRREMLKNLPEYNSQTMDETRKRTALVMQTLKEASECNENISRGIGRK